MSGGGAMMDELRKIIFDMKEKGISLSTMLKIIKELYRASK